MISKFKIAHDIAVKARAATMVTLKAVRLDPPPDELCNAMVGKTRAHSLRGHPGQAGWD